MALKRVSPFLALSLLGIALYSCVLPLWEGWDEPYHYGYVESLAVEQEMPVLGKTTISGEIARSLTLTPLSRFASDLVPGRMPFEQWHLWPNSRRIAMRSQLEQLSPSLRNAPGAPNNYEAQQTPLAYLLLVPLDLALSHLQIVPRILILRGIEGLSAMFLVYLILIRLCRLLEIGDIYQAALLVCALSVQTLWATIGHVGNDAPAVVLTLWFLALLVGAAPLLLVSGVLAAGLLTKAYFLAFVPVFVLYAVRVRQQKRATVREVVLSVLIPCLISGPWFLRNQILYQSFSGTQESVGGVTFRKAMGAIPHIRWDLSALSFFRQSLWCGNWSFTSYARGTLTVALVLMLAALVVYAWQWGKIREGEIWLWLSAAAFLIGLVYQTCVTWVSSHGLATSPEPWYWQGIFLGIWVMLFAGLARLNNLWGRVIASLLTTVFAWIAMTTFLVKLLPYYGAGINRATLPALRTFWGAHPSQDLRGAVLGPLPLIYVLLCAYLLLLVTAVALVLRMAVVSNRNPVGKAQAPARVRG